MLLYIDYFHPSSQPYFTIPGVEDRIGQWWSVNDRLTRYEVYLKLESVCTITTWISKLCGQTVNLTSGQTPDLRGL